MNSISLIPLFSAFVSVIALLLVMFIFNKVYQENYKKPWLFIGISILFLAFSKIISFLSGFLMIYIINKNVSSFIADSLDFISISILTYAILLEFMILKYYKGRFVKFRFIPVQEKNLEGELDISVSKSNSYLAYNKDIDFLNSQFSLATRIGYEGFLITEYNPGEFRKRYGLEKTPIAWISQIQINSSTDFLKDSLDKNSEIVSPINLNEIINYNDSFLEQSSSPFIMLDLNLILKFNNFKVVYEFLEYLIQKTKKYNGILICRINENVLEDYDLNKLKLIFKILE